MLSIFSSLFFSLFSFLLSKSKHTINGITAPPSPCFPSKDYRIHVSQVEKICKRPKQKDRNSVTALDSAMQAYGQYINWAISSLVVRNCSARTQYASLLLGLMLLGPVLFSNNSILVTTDSLWKNKT